MSATSSLFAAMEVSSETLSPDTSIAAKREEVALMSFFETEETNQFTFEAFAAHPFYTAINRSLVQQALAPLVIRPTGATLTLVDMACGTGAITRLIAEELAHQRRQSRILAVHPSADALRHAHNTLNVLRTDHDFFHDENYHLPTP